MTLIHYSDNVNSYNSLTQKFLIFFNLECCRLLVKFTLDEPRFVAQFAQV